jgi:peptidoglycan/LPS O-acetylase OafA/YrhL
VAQFFMARIGRVWPAHLFGILLFAILNPNWWLPVACKIPYITLANVFLIQAWVPKSTWYFSLNATAWSVSTECFFYLAFPLLIKNWSSTWSKKLLGSVVLIVSVITLCNFLQMHGTHTPILNIYHALIYINPCSRIFEFVVGMATARLFVELQQKQISAKTASVLEYSIFGLILLNLYLTPLFLGPDHLHSLQAGVHWLNYASGTPLYAALIAILALQRGSLSRILSTGWLVFLGETSYSMYIFHWIILQKFFSSPMPEHMVWPMFALYCATVIIAGVIGYYCVEQPFRKLFKKLGKSFR